MQDKCKVVIKLVRALGTLQATVCQRVPGVDFASSVWSKTVLTSVLCKTKIRLQRTNLVPETYQGQHVVRFSFSVAAPHNVFRRGHGCFQ